MTDELQAFDDLVVHLTGASRPASDVGIRPVGRAAGSAALRTTLCKNARQNCERIKDDGSAVGNTRPANVTSDPAGGENGQFPGR